MVEGAHKKKFFAKVVLLGDINVGKTTLINKFTTGVASNQQNTIGSDFKTKAITVKDTTVTI